MGIRSSADRLLVRHEQAQAALRSIEATSRNALAEMRGILGVLRADPPWTGGDRQPMSGLGGLRELAERAQAAAVAVDLVIDVDTPMPAGVELAVCRIV